MASPSIFYYAFDQVGLAGVTGAAGSLISQILDPCLINGFNQRTVTGISYDSATGLATATTSVAHGMQFNDVAEFSGADQAGFNGKARIVATPSTTQIVYKPASAPGASAATGASLSVKRAAAGWTKTWSGTNQAAYKHAASLSQGTLFVDDAAGSSQGARNALARGFEAFSGGVGTRGFPTPTQMSEGEYIRKSSTLDAVARPWELVAINDDGEGGGPFIYLFIDWSATTRASAIFSTFMFGDFKSFRPGDVYPCLIAGCAAAAPADTKANAVWTARRPFNAFIQNNGVYLSGQGAFGAANPGCYLMRDYAGTINDPVGICVNASDLAVGYSDPGTAGGTNRVAAGMPVGTGFFPYPAVIDGGFLFSKILIVEQTVNPAGSTPRGFLPGVLAPCHDRPGSNAGRAWTGLAGYDGHYFGSFAIGSQAVSNSTVGTGYEGRVLVNLTGKTNG